MAQSLMGERMSAHVQKQTNPGSTQICVYNTLF